MSKVEKARQSWDIEIDRSKRDGIARTASSRRCVWRYIQKKKKKKRERKWKRKKEKWRKEGKMLERRVIGGTGWIPFGVVRSKFDWRTNRRHWRRNIRKLERPGEAGTQPRIGQWPTIGSHPIFACQFRGRYCAVDNAPIITLNGDHSYAHSAGFKPPFRIHYRRAAQIIAPMRAASSFFFFFSPLPTAASCRWHRLSIGRFKYVSSGVFTSENHNEIRSAPSCLWLCYFVAALCVTPIPTVIKWSSFSLRKLHG